MQVLEKKHRLNLLLWFYAYFLLKLVKVIRNMWSFLLQSCICNDISSKIYIHTYILLHVRWIKYKIYCLSKCAPHPQAQLSSAQFSFNLISLIVYQYLKDFFFQCFIMVRTWILKSGELFWALAEPFTEHLLGCLFILFKSISSLTKWRRRYLLCSPSNESAKLVIINFKRLT